MSVVVDDLVHLVVRWLQTIEDNGFLVAGGDELVVTLGFDDGTKSARGRSHEHRCSFLLLQAGLG